jgi:hypothetical protein
MEEITADTQKDTNQVKEAWLKPKITVLGVKNETLGYDNVQVDHNNSGSFGS